MLVKICGLSNVLDARCATASGATALGFVMGGKVLPVEVEPHAQTVRDIIRELPKSIETFVVTHLFDPDDIVELTEYVHASGIQISENIGVDAVRKVREMTSKRIIKTVVAGGDDCFERLKSYEPFCDFILLDSYVAGYVGGTGATSDWVVCKKLIDSASKPVFLAGGLTPDNLERAIRSTNPDGVDVSTGVSTYCPEYLRKDRKDPAKIGAFISIARSFARDAVS